VQYDLRNAQRQRQQLRFQTSVRGETWMDAECAAVSALKENDQGPLL
jgi:hypothetical protein